MAILARIKRLKPIKTLTIFMVENNFGFNFSFLSKKKNNCHLSLEKNRNLLVKIAL